MTIEPVALAGYRERIARDAGGRVEQHFVILPFAARWVAGEPVLNEELAEARWLVPSELAGLTTTEGLAEIVAAALEIVEASAASDRDWSILNECFPTGNTPSSHPPRALKSSIAFGNHWLV